jgi:alpha-galactosidase/6-phospho-beta-glucosidase family protein
LGLKGQRTRRFSQYLAGNTTSPILFEPVLGEGIWRLQTVDIIRSLLKNGNCYVLFLNVPNKGYITNLRQGAIVEVPAVVNVGRIYRPGMGDLPLAIAWLLERQLTIMDLNVEAAVTGDRRTALEGLILDPLVPDPAMAEKILDAMLVAQAEYLLRFQ